MAPELDFASPTAPACVAYHPDFQPMTSATPDPGVERAHADDVEAARDLILADVAVTTPSLYPVIARGVVDDVVRDRDLGGGDRWSSARWGGRLRARVAPPVVDLVGKRHRRYRITVLIIAQRFLEELWIAVLAMMPACRTARAATRAS